jgi:hypothetical protein
LQLLVDTGAEKRTYYYATAALSFNGVSWSPQLRKTSTLRSSLSKAANQATLDLQNVDAKLGIEFLKIQQFLFGAIAQVGRYWIDQNGGSPIHAILLTGLISGIDIGEETVTLTAVADCYSGINVGPNHRVTRICQWQTQGAFRGPECGYNGPEPVCNGLINDPGGCEGRHGTPLKFDRFGAFPYIDNAQKLVTGS